MYAKAIFFPYILWSKIILIECAYTYVFNRIYIESNKCESMNLNKLQIILWFYKFIFTLEYKHTCTVSDKPYWTKIDSSWFYMKTKNKKKHSYGHNRSKKIKRNGL